MNRRNFLVALLSVPAVAALLDACGSDDQSEESSTSAGEARSSVPRTATTAADATPAAAAVDAFAMDLYRLLASSTSGNLVVSPVSIATALAMTAVGAKGATADEMYSTLRVEDRATIDRAMNALLAELASRSTGDVTLTIANSLWTQQGTSIESAFLDTLSAEYDAGVQLVDFEDDPDGSRVQINEWVADATEDRIPELIAEGLITSDTIFTIVNAVYLKAPWLTTFDPDRTQDGSFTTATGEAVSVPMMTLSSTLPYATGDGWQAVELPYVESALSMLVFLPEPGFLGDFEQIFLPTDATQYLAPALVDLTMPKFEIESALSLGETLGALGMELAFADDADFTGITSDIPLKISEVVHQANISVDENGTEAAAATAVIGVAGAAPSPDSPVEFLVDRPFVFVLRDRVTNAIVFLGRVADPSGTAA